MNILVNFLKIEKKEICVVHLAMIKNIQIYISLNLPLKLQRYMYMYRIYQFMIVCKAIKLHN